MKLSLKNTLLASTAFIAFSMGGISLAQAQTELANGVAIVATDAAGVTETDSTNTVTVDTSGAAIILGADGTDSVIMNSAGNSLTMDISGAANSLTFADDITETDGEVVINITDATAVIFQGNVSASPITAGSAGADPTTVLTFDTANNENLTIAATIGAIDAADTVNLDITNTDGNANTIIFTGAIGGVTTETAVDTITVGATDNQNIDTTFGASVNAGTITIGTGAGTADTNNVRFGANGSTSTVTGTISGGDAGDTNNVHVVGGATVTFVTGFGADIDTIQLGSDGADTTATIQGAVDSGAIVIGAGVGADTNSLALDTTNGAFTVAETITGGDAADANTLLVVGGNVGTVTGAVGVGGTLDTVTLSGAGTGLTLGSTLTAGDINIGAGTILTSGGAVTGDVDFTGEGTLTLNHGLVGTIDNDTGAPGVGTLTTTAGTFTITGAVGGTNSLLAIENSGVGIVTFADTVAATNITQSGTGNMLFSNTVTATTITQSGAGNMLFSDAVTATTIRVSDDAGLLDFDADVTGNVEFAADAEATIADTHNIAGNIDNTTGANGAGTLTVEGTTSVAGNVGATNTLKIITAGAAGTTATFSGTVAADDIDFVAAGDVVFAGNTTVTNNVDFAGFDGTATFADDANFTGDIEDTGAGGEGGVDFAGSSVVTGNLGTVGNSLDRVNFGGGAGTAVMVSGGVDTDSDVSLGAGSVLITGQATVGNDFLFTDDGSITFADGLVSIGGGVVTGADSEGTITFLGAGTIAGDFSSEALELKTLTLSGTGKTLAIGGNMNIADTTTLGTNIITVAGTVDVDAGQTLKVTITGDTDGENGLINSTGDATVDAAALLDLTVDTNEFIANATEYTIIDGNAGGGVAAGISITDDYALLSFTQKADADNLVVVASRSAMKSLVTPGNNSNVAAVLDSLGNGGDAGLDSVQGVLQRSASAAELDERMAALTPTVDGGFVTGGMQASAMNKGATNMRLAAVRMGEVPRSGMVAGEMGQGVTTWVKGFGQMATQDRRDGIAGYDADTYGMTAGIDTENAFENGVVGVSLGYANTAIDSKNANTTQTDVNSYQLSAYGNYDYGRNGYVNGMVGYAHNSIEQNRNNVAGIAGNTAQADFSSGQYIAYAEVGRGFEASYITTITPKALLNYQHITMDEYTETGSTANQMVAIDDMDIFELGVGVTAEWALVDYAGYKIRPSVNMGYRYDMIGDAVQATSRFTGGGASFATQGSDPARGTFNTGAALIYEMTDRLELTAEYDYQLKEDYSAHSASLRAGYKL